MAKKILLVEDDPFLIDIYNKKFTNAGYKVEVAEDGKKAMKSLKKSTPDLVLLDIVLPEIMGWQVLSEIRKNKKLSGLKIIVLSNLGQRQEVVKGLGLGAEKYLIKAQFTPAQVVAQVQSLLTKN